MKRKEKEILGWREWVSLPDLHVKKIKVKVDSGAKTSALHVSDVKIIKTLRKSTVHFTIHPIQHSNHPTIHCKADMIDERPVKSSSGLATVRPVIQTLMKVDGIEWPIELTLVNRDMMGFRMLLGRQAIRGKFLVDPARSFLKKKRKKGKEIL